VLIQKLDENHYTISVSEVEDGEDIVLHIRVIDSVSAQSVEQNVILKGKEEQPQFFSNVLNYWIA